MLKKLQFLSILSIDNSLKKLRPSHLVGLAFLCWFIMSAAEKAPEVLSPDKINLALRRTADQLLRESCDSTSRIPAVEQDEEGVWLVRLDQPFDYDNLPSILQSSLDLYGITQPYQVTVRRCEDRAIDLGYHKFDFYGQHQVACGGRVMPTGCHFIEISFLEANGKKPFQPNKGQLALLIFGGVAGFWFLRRQKTIPPSSSTNESTLIEFGNSRLDVANQILLCGNERQTLTFRESKLLQLFATNTDKLLERDFILQEVWANEGVLVGRSIDVFVSRLRKKLAADPSVSIVVVHGVGYRMELTKE